MGEKEIHFRKYFHCTAHQMNHSAKSNIEEGYLYDDPFRTSVEEVLEFGHMVSNFGLITNGIGSDTENRFGKRREKDMQNCPVVG